MKIKVNMPTLTILILTYNSSKYISSCLNSILSEIKRYKIRAQIVVVDNKSSDKTTQIIKKIPKVRIISNKVNLGFAGGLNQVLRKINTDYVLILNPDTIVKNHGISQLLSNTVKHKADISSGTILNFNRKKQDSYAQKPTILTVLFVYTNLRKIVPYDHFYNQHYYRTKKITKPQEVEMVTGGYMLVSTKVFEKIGYFDKNFFMYLEDVDFCLRARKRGLKIMLFPDCKIMHFGGGSTQTTEKIIFKAWFHSRRYFANKHFSQFSNIFIQPIMILDMIGILLWRSFKKIYNAT